MGNYWERSGIRLRAFDDRDLEKYIKEKNNPDSLRQWYEDYLEFPLSEVEIKKSMDEYLNSLKGEDKRLFIIESLDLNYVGELSIWHTEKRNGVFRYGIFLDSKFRGHGYAKEALIIVMDYYFNELNYQKCSPTVYSFNRNSQKFHEKFGFIKEGQLRRHVYTRGTYHDLIYYGMTKDEFNYLYKHDFN